MSSSPLASKRALITGGAGFIGSNLARRLVELGAVVTIVDSLIPEYGGNLFNLAGIRELVRLNIADIRDPHSMRYLVQGQDVLFNLAAQTSHMDSMQSPSVDLDINCRSQLALLEACRHLNPGIKVVFASTRQIYGRPEYLPVDERHPIHPVDVNGINKAAGEQYHLLYNEVYGIRSCVLRLTNTYGPGMRVKDSRQTFVGIWIRQLLEGQPFEVWGGEQLRDFTYVNDCVAALVMAAESEKTNGRVFNIGDQHPVSLRELAAMLVELNGSGTYTIRDLPESRRRIDIGDYYSDSRSYSAAVGWSPQVTLADGLTRTLAYYRENLGRYV